jgi:hypothetical protein
VHLADAIRSLDRNADRVVAVEERERAVRPLPNLIKKLRERDLRCELLLVCGFRRRKSLIPI